MARALALAARAEGETNPNPLVGCVVVRDGRVVGEGFHARAGTAHAEPLALAAAGRRAAGATLYVNLEPCAHHGRTGPCADLVAASGVARVVAAVRDPNPRVAGRGAARLRRAGVVVDFGPGAGPARALNEVFLAAAALDRPYVLLKAALTLDGRIATAAGESKWLTSPAARHAARRLRRSFDGVAVGVGTVLADDPELLPRPRVRRPFHRVVFDSRLRTPVTSRLVRGARRHPVIVVGVEGSARPARAAALERAGARVLLVRGADGRVDLAAALSALRARDGLWSLMVEGGGEVLGALARARLVDKLVLFRAPLILGGRRARPAFGGPELGRLADALHLRPARPPVDLCEAWQPER